MLRVDIAGERASGKTTELLRIAAELTVLGKTVALVNNDEFRMALVDRFMQNGGVSADFIIFASVEEAMEFSMRGGNCIEYILTETTVQPSPNADLAPHYDPRFRPDGTRRRIEGKVLKVDRLTEEVHINVKDRVFNIKLPAGEGTTAEPGDNVQAVVEWRDENWHIEQMTVNNG